MTSILLPTRKVDIRFYGGFMGRDVTDRPTDRARVIELATRIRR